MQLDPDDADSESSNIDNTDEDMEDLALDVETKVYALGKSLPAILRQRILEANPSYYLHEWNIEVEGKQFFVRVTDILELRGADVNKRFLPDLFDSGRRVKTVVILSDRAVGKHLELSLESALSREEEAPAQNQQKGNQKGKQKAQQKGWGNQGSKQTASEEPPADECVKVKFHTDTQTPHIEISTMDTDTGNVISTRFFASEFDFINGPESSDFTVKESVEVDPSSIQDKCQVIHDMNRMASLEKTAVVHVNIVLYEAKPDRVWEGIFDSSLAAMQANPTDSVRDQLITGRDRETTITLAFSSKRTAGHLAKWKTKFRDYFATPLFLARHAGNFWFYCWQCIQEDAPGGNLPSFESISLELTSWSHDG